MKISSQVILLKTRDGHLIAHKLDMPARPDLIFCLTEYPRFGDVLDMKADMDRVPTRRYEYLEEVVRVYREVE